MGCFRQRTSNGAAILPQQSCKENFESALKLSAMDDAAELPQCWGA